MYDHKAYFTLKVGTIIERSWEDE